MKNERNIVAYILNKLIKYFTMNKFKYLFITLFTLILLPGCGTKEAETDFRVEGVEFSEAKDMDIQQYNLARERELTSKSTPCDTLSLVEYVLNNYPAGTYIVDFDKTYTYNVPKPALLFHGKEKNYVFAVIARSRPGERLIEKKNIVGYDQSFIDLDSTKLGTAFFYLSMFECTGSDWNLVWEAPVPSHGGFNTFSVEHWQQKNTPYVKINFHDARGIGHIDYNYFFVDGITSFPHLLMTYKGINYKRTIGNVNNDKFPDYYEHIYYDLGDKVFSKDSVAFVWVEKDSLYVNTRNKRQTRPY
jgi:hypothetical protein